ncbi:MAG: hypothetical protein HW404_1045 [Anaerolineales bacterium]|jgi:hypothetical protein|nr:hypothetical protein [Anaerolineales bacterium]MBM2843208.1 hypothetical protein [Anaerolineales bacterium]
MPRIRCRYVDCVFLEDGYCGAAAVEIDPDEGCLTYSHIEDVPTEEAWDEEEIDEIWEEEEEDLYEADEEEEEEATDDEDG